MRFARLAVGACLAVTVAGCTPPPAVTGTSDAGTSHASSAKREVPLSAAFTPFGAQRVWASGLAITVSPPKSLRPSDTAFPKASRSAVFVVTINNNTRATIRPPQLAVRATAEGKTAQEVLDSVQGLNGVAAAINELPPGKDTTVTLAFAVPEAPVRMQLTVQLNSSGQEPTAVFEGQA